MMEGCVTFAALGAFVVAVAALILAKSVRDELRELRGMLARGEIRVPQSPAAQPIAQPIAQPTPPQAPMPAAIVTAPPPPIAPIPPPAPAPPPPIHAAAPDNRQPITDNKPKGIDWENLVGIKLFSWIAGIALVLAAVFLFKYSIDHGWLRPAVRATMGMIAGVGLLLACELRVARNYRFTANAMDGAGIAILYATLFALHGTWHLWPATAAFLGMIVVTAAAVFLSTRRDSIFIALLGLLGGFATPALLSSGENRPLALFSYLLLLNGGISWIAFRKRWPVLTALSVALTAFYQWTWVSDYLTRGQLPLAAAIFLVFACVAVVSFWGELQFRRIAAAGAVLPLLFAFFTAVVPEYGASYNVLFGFLLLLAAGFAAIAIWRGPEWLHALGGASALVTFFLWLIVSYTHDSWPLSLVWLAAFIVLYLVAGLRLRSVAVYTAPLLFFVFTGLAIREPARYGTLTGALFAMLAIVFVYALLRGLPHVASIAIAFGTITIIALDDAPFRLALAAYAALFVAALTIAWVRERHGIVLAALPFFITALIASSRFADGESFAIGALLYLMFLAYPLVLGARVKRALAPHLAAILASVIFFVHAYLLRTELGFAEYIGFLPIAEALLLLVLLWRLLRLDPQPGRLALVAAAVLAFLTTAIPLQLEKEWITVGLALEAAALAWLFTRIPHRGLLLWCGGLTAAVFARLAFNPAVFEYHPKSATPVLNWYLYTYLFCAIAGFVIAWTAPRGETLLRRLAAVCATLELFVLLNIEIADFYSTGDGLTFNFMGSSLAQDLTYTMAWAVFAMVTLIAGIALHARGARVAALGLLLVTILKCFLHDLARLGGLYRVGSLFGLAVSLVLVGLMLQKFVMMRREAV
jgi:uncharacterized membrane protein